ncbi:DUF1616 domain-containing protein [Haloarcula marina]|uniref:DUF1616 domain-containing protein n=1 Tax=Haloarcula marina TaxID=2961574 RepID=UPI0020B66213|nr:DUF1616 domain-containing protein [Halomicroarcula marina]
MSVSETARRLAASTLETVPVDLLVLVAYVVFATATVGAGVGGTVVLFLVGGVLVLFAPGYAVVAALFPGRPTTRDAGEGAIALSLGSAHDGLLARERLALSFGVSVTLIPLLAVTLGAFGVQLTTESVLATVWLIVGSGVVIGAVRRLALPPNERFDALTIARQSSGEGLLAGDALTKALTVCLLVCVVAAVGSLSVALAGADQSMSFTSASLLTESSDGEFIAGGYPTNGSVGESQPLAVRVTNHHDSAANYTVVAKLQRVDGGSVLASDELFRTGQHVGVDETWTYDHTVTPTMAGQDLRLVYYVVRGPVPDQINEGSADRVLYLRIDVSPN